MLSMPSQYVTRALGLAVGVVCAVSILTAPALAQSAGGSSDPGLFFATSEIAQVMLSIGAVAFVIQAARAYGGEIGRALYVAGGGVILFAIWRLLEGASRLLDLQRPPSSIGSAVYLIVTVLLLAGFYMLYDTMSGRTTA
jgi:hypothetical protein